MSLGFARQRHGKEELTTVMTVREDRFDPLGVESTGFLHGSGEGGEHDDP